MKEARTKFAFNISGTDSKPARKTPPSSLFIKDCRHKISISTHLEFYSTSGQAAEELWKYSNLVIYFNCPKNENVLQVV